MFLPRFFNYILLTIWLSHPLLIASESSPGPDRKRKAHIEKSNPLIALTRDLKKTYTRINETYYKRKRLDHPLHADLVFNGRYQLLESHGTGVSCQVWKAKDKKTGQDVAIKIFPKRWPRQHIEKEISCLRRLQSIQVPHTPMVLAGFNLTDKAYGQYCLVFDYLEQNLLALIKQTHDQGLWLRDVQSFAKQLLQTLAHLEKEGIIHADIKPENIMQHSKKRVKIQLIDFGCVEQTPFK